MVGSAPRVLFHESILPQAACLSGQLPAVTAWFRTPCSVASRRCFALWAKIPWVTPMGKILSPPRGSICILLHYRGLRARLWRPLHPRLCFYRRDVDLFFSPPCGYGMVLHFARVRVATMFLPSGRSAQHAMREGGIFPILKCITNLYTSFKFNNHKDSCKIIHDL